MNVEDGAGEEILVVLRLLQRFLKQNEKGVRKCRNAERVRARAQFVAQSVMGKGD
jgi:hypothetical protein